MEEDVGHSRKVNRPDERSVKYGTPGLFACLNRGRRTEGERLDRIVLLGAFLLRGRSPANGEVSGGFAERSVQAEMKGWGRRV